MWILAGALLVTALEIDIAPARTQIVPARDLRVLCRADHPVDACTEFRGEVLRCRCERNGAQWKITARAQLIPYVYLSAPHRSVQAHEKLHLEDLRERIESYLMDVTRATHADRETCESVAHFESATFTLRMDLFRRLSNRKLH